MTLLALAQPNVAEVLEKTVKVAHPLTIDFSVLDTILGLAAGLVATGAVFLLVGYLLIRFKLISFGMANVQVQEANGIMYDRCPAHAAEHERSLGNEKKIEVLFEKYNVLRDSVSSIKTDLAVLKGGQDQMIALLQRKRV